jgi:chromosome partitioning protein
MRILIHTQKGGVGKTTTAVNLAAALLREGYGRRVLLADLDPQRHLTAMVVTDKDHTNGPWPVRGEPGLFHMQAADQPDVDPFAPSPRFEADWTILDTAPSWSPKVADACSRADLILCPLEPDFLGLSGVGRMLEQIAAHGVDRDRMRFLLTRFNARLALHREVRERLTMRFGDLLLPNEIRTSVKLAEAPGMGMTIFSHSPGSTGCSDYRDLAATLALTLKRRKTAA